MVCITAESNCYLYVDRNIDTGVLTYGYSLFAPAYQNLALRPIDGSTLVDLNSYYMKRWNGTAWENKQRVFTCMHHGRGFATNVTCYALQGGPLPIVLLYQPANCKHCLTTSAEPGKSCSVFVCIDDDVDMSLGTKSWKHPTTPLSAVV